MKVDRKRKKSIFLRLALLAFSIYVIMQLLIDDQKNKMENYESYQEQQARENGQARPGESIYKEIPGA